MNLDEEDDAPPPVNPQDALGLASRIRVNREALATYEGQVATMIENLRTLHPPFGVAWDEVKRLKVQIPELEEAIKDLARSRGTTLDCSSQGIRVKYSNPVRRSLAYEALLSIAPNINELLPDAVVRTVEVDLKVVDVAVAAGMLPDSVLKLIVETPTTKNGRVEIEQVKPK